MKKKDAQLVGLNVASGVSRPTGQGRDLISCYWSSRCGMAQDVIEKQLLRSHFNTRSKGQPSPQQQNSAMTAVRLVQPVSRVVQLTLGQAVRVTVAASAPTSARHRPSLGSLRFLSTPSAPASASAALAKPAEEQQLAAASSSGPELRPYQKECIAECLYALQQGYSRIGVSSPTGSGKTTIL